MLCKKKVHSLERGGRAPIINTHYRMALIRQKSNFPPPPIAPQAMEKPAASHVDVQGLHGRSKMKEPSFDAPLGFCGEMFEAPLGGESSPRRVLVVNPQRAFVATQ